MSLKIGVPPPQKMEEGSMSYQIYTQLDEILSPPLQASMSAEQLNDVRAGWKKLAYAIAKGVIEHLTANLEIYGIETKGDLPIKGNTGTALPNNHLHALDLSIPQVNFKQSNEGIGHVK
ncbi:hypothetical protein THII_2014 [Thioploca ingrica]|uniref:Uncharacterized protein n=1 Tax=Thioploca ingrica TaxID=40754 RepID=A0A090BV64_9GAMM|nr:hypothetical protein THII_2014 [Thioploca ingrica]